MTNYLDILLKENLITKDQLEDARIKQIGAKKSLHDVLIDMGFLKEEDLLRVCAQAYNLPIVDLNTQSLEPKAVKLVPYETAKRYGVFPLGIQGGKLVLAMSNPCDLMALEDIALLANTEIKSALAKKGDIEKHIEEYYFMDDAMYDLLKHMVEDVKLEFVGEEKAPKNLMDMARDHKDSSPVIRLLNLIMGDAVKANASDVHIEVFETEVLVRYRVDGNLKNIIKVPKKLHPPLLVRIKVLADLDITETRKPQDGRCRLLVNGQKVDLRISTVPAFHGEKTVIRLLNTSQKQKDIDHIGMEAADLAVFKDVIQRPQGIILITGPTGSGKTSTIYAALNFIRRESKNIITIEDPVEYLIEGVNQIQVNPAIDMTFAKGLRSILRQDPNVILVGEIRDQETAEIAFRSSLTGHLVFSTLHTNNSLASITRLRDIGLESYLIASSIVMIVAQRLIRLNCPQCKEAYQPAPAVLDKFKAQLPAGQVFHKGKGCEQCGFSGFSGRTAIFEMLVLNDALRHFISEGAAQDKLMEEAKKAGFKTLLESGLEKVMGGHTTLEEAAQICGVAEGGAFQAPVHVPAASTTEGTSKKLILIVEDEADIRLILAKRLEVAGYRVIQAQDGAEGVAKAQAEKPDLILMDLMMPRLNGIEAIKKLRSLLETAGTPIILLTAVKEKESELQGLDAGADDYITKPFDHDKLLSRIKMLLRRKA